MNAKRLLPSLVCSLLGALSDPVFAATDLVQFESCPRVSVKVERSGRLSSLMVIDQEHPAWAAASVAVEQSGRRLDWLLLDEDASVQLLYSESTPLPHQGTISSSEFADLQIAEPVGKIVDKRPQVRSEERVQQVALLSRPKAGASGDEYLAQAEIMALVDGCVIGVSVLMPGAVLQEAADILGDLQFSGRPVKNTPTP